MKAEFYVNFKAKKGYRDFSLAGAPKTSIKKPTVNANEVCVKMVIDIPDVLFEKAILSLAGKIEFDPETQKPTFIEEMKAL